MSPCFKFPVARNSRILFAGSRFALLHVPGERQCAAAVSHSSLGHSVTQKDIAQKLGLAQSSVSKALKNDPEIEPATRERVQAAAREMGYQPNAMAAGLAHFKQTSKTKPIEASLAWIHAWPDPEKFHRFRELDLCWQGARRSAEKFGYRFEEFTVTKDMPLSRIEKILRARNIRGVLILAHGGLQVNWQRFDWEHFSTVRLGTPSEELPLPLFHSVSADQPFNAALAFSKMRERGYERIGFLGFGTWHRAGFVQRQCDEPEKSRVPPFNWPAHTPAMMTPALDKWLKRHMPDAILTEIPDTVEIFTKAGYRIPEDIALAGTTVLDIPGVDAGIDQHPEETGSITSLALISLINDNDRGTPAIQHTILVKGTWVDGKSLPPRL